MPDSSLSGGDMALVAVVLVISLAALGFAAYLVKAVMAAPGKLDRLTKEIIAVAVSAVNACAY